MRRRFVVVLALGGFLAAVLAAAFAFAGLRGQGAERRIGLFTTLPILWNEAPDLKGMIDPPPVPHWARAALESNGKLIALDTLLDLQRIDLLVAVQPRPLLPEENVALDDWVRRGGRVLLFADPMLTQDSAFPLGDRRRPQGVALLSPILARWGLQLRFDDAQALGERESPGENLPVNLPGTLALVPGGHEASCVIGQAQLVARCRVGKGRATIVADAALFEPREDQDSRTLKLQKLIDETLGI